MPEKPARARPDDATHTVLDAIRHIVRALRISARAAEARVGLSAAQLFVLHRLADGARLSLGELAARTMTHPSSVSVVVGRLVDAALVSRVRSARDGRRVELAITPRGRALTRRAPGAAQDALIDALSALPSAERRALARTLARVVAAMGLGAEPPRLFFEDDETDPVAATDDDDRDAARPVRRGSTQRAQPRRRRRRQQQERQRPPPPGPAAQRPPRR